MTSRKKSKRNLLLHIIILGLILFTQIFYDFVYAQDVNDYDQHVPIVSDPALKLKLDPPTYQSYPSKKITLTLEIDSSIDSNRVGVKWFYPVTLFEIEGSDRDVVSVTKGNKTTITKAFIPRKSLPIATSNRNVNFATEVNAFLAGENYLSSTDLKVVFTPDMIVSPTLSSYVQERNILIFKVWSTRIGIVLFFGLAVVFVVKQFRDYLNIDDVV